MVLYWLFWFAWLTTNVLQVQTRSAEINFNDINFRCRRVGLFADRSVCGRYYSCEPSVDGTFHRRLLECSIGQTFDERSRSCQPMNSRQQERCSNFPSQPGLSHINRPNRPSNHNHRLPNNHRRNAPSRTVINYNDYNHNRRQKRSIDQDLQRRLLADYLNTLKFKQNLQNNLRHARSSRSRLRDQLADREKTDLLWDQLLGSSSTVAPEHGSSNVERTSENDNVNLEPFQPFYTTIQPINHTEDKELNNVTTSSETLTTNSAFNKEDQPNIDKVQTLPSNNPNTTNQPDVDISPHETNNKSSAIETIPDNIREPLPFDVLAVLEKSTESDSNLHGNTPKELDNLLDKLLLNNTESSKKSADINSTTFEGKTEQVENLKTTSLNDIITVTTEKIEIDITTSISTTLSSNGDPDCNLDSTSTLQNKDKPIDLVNPFDVDSENVKNNSETSLNSEAMKGSNQTSDQSINLTNIENSFNISNQEGNSPLLNDTEESVDTKLLTTPQPPAKLSPTHISQTFDDYPKTNQDSNAFQPNTLSKKVQTNNFKVKTHRRPPISSSKRNTIPHTLSSGKRRHYSDRRKPVRLSQSAIHVIDDFANQTPSSFVKQQKQQWHRLHHRFHHRQHHNKYHRYYPSHPYHLKRSNHLSYPLTNSQTKFINRRLANGRRRNTLGFHRTNANINEIVNTALSPQYILNSKTISPVRLAPNIEILSNSEAIPLESNLSKIDQVSETEQAKLFHLQQKNIANQVKPKHFPVSNWSTRMQSDSRGYQWSVIVHPDKNPVLSHHTWQNNEPVDDACKDNGFIRHPSDCNRFFRCVCQNGKVFNKFEFFCGSGLVFDARLGICLWPSGLNPCLQTQTDEQISSNPTFSPSSDSTPVSSDTSLPPENVPESTIDTEESVDVPPELVNTSNENPQANDEKIAFASTPERSVVLTESLPEKVEEIPDKLVSVGVIEPVPPVHPDLHSPDQLLPAFVRAETSGILDDEHRPYLPNYSRDILDVDDVLANDQPISHRYFF